MITLIILNDINEQLSVVENEITTTKRRLLNKTFKQEYDANFHFISLILGYSETQELDNSPLGSCLNAFESFCKSMPPEFLFPTRINEFILGLLSSPHSIATLDRPSEIIELRKTNKDSGMSELSLKY